MGKFKNSGKTDEKQDPLGSLEGVSVRMNSASGGHIVIDSFPLVYDTVRRRHFKVSEPYWFTFKCVAKGRWFGKKIIEIMKEEFRFRDVQYYRDSLINGNIKVNDKFVDPSYIISNGDNITHSCLNVEPAATVENVRVLFENDSFLVAHKPSGIPVQLKGRYHKLSLLYILKNFYLEDCLVYLHPIFRLDGVTSGLVVLAKTRAAASKFSASLKNAEKYYIAKVQGKFMISADCFPHMDLGRENLKLRPIELCRFRLLAETIGTDNDESFFSVCRGDNDEILVSCCIKIVRDEGKLYGKPYCDARNQDSKYAVTAFKLLLFDGISSLVLCRPLTGRTHQIRLHLKCLKYCIIHDSLYSDRNEMHIPNMEPKFLDSYVYDDQIYNRILPVQNIPTDDISNEFRTRCLDYEQTYEIPEPLEICLHAFQYMFNLTELNEECHTDSFQLFPADLISRIFSSSNHKCVEVHDDTLNVRGKIIVNDYVFPKWLSDMLIECKLEK